MKRILVTGADGFLGKNLVTTLQKNPEADVLQCRRGDNENELRECLKKVDWIIHLAGVNRPDNVSEFEEVNVEYTKTLIKILSETASSPSIIFSSSSQAGLENPYGRSKKRAEDVLIRYANGGKNNVCIYRLPNLFGKWCQPNYNSVVATFCHNIANGIDININNENSLLNLAYVDDVVDEWVNLIFKESAQNEVYHYHIKKIFTVKLGMVAEKVYEFRKSRKNLFIPDLSDDFSRYLYTTYLSYLPKNDFANDLQKRTDERGDLTELFKSPHFGQVFISSTKPGITRGNHYHHTKVEKFCVIKGKAVIRFRHILNDEIIEYPTTGEHMQTVDIPPGYTHSIENISDEELIVLFWANEPFDSDKPDTYYEEVLP